MPITTYTLTADLNKIAGSDDYRIVSAHLTTNQPADVPIVDKSGKTIRLPGPRKLVVDVDGTITETVIASDSPDINITDSSLRYQVTVEYQTTVRQHVVRPRTWTSPWFSVTAATDLADKLEDEYLPPTVASAAIEQVNAAVAQAEAARDAAVDISNIDTSDGLVSTLVADPGSATGAALSEATEAQVSADAVNSATAIGASVATAISRKLADTTLGGVEAFDMFDRADATSLGTTATGEIWTTLTAAGTWQVVDGHAVPAATGDSRTVYDSGVADGAVEATVKCGASGSTIGVIFRGIDAANLLWVDINGSALRIMRRNAGANSALASTGVATAAGQWCKIGVKFDGASVTATLRDLSGALLASVTHTLSAGNMTTYGSATRVGLASYQGSGAKVANHFFRSDLTVPLVTVGSATFAETKADTAAMQDGYTLFMPLEASEVWWFKGNKPAAMFKAEGRVGVVRQYESHLFAIVGSSAMVYDQTGTRVLAKYAASLPGDVHHDIIRTPEGNIAFLVRDYLTPGGVSDDLYVEIDWTGTVIKQFSLNTALWGDPAGSAGLGEQWLHSNSLDYYPNGDLLVSLRNRDELGRFDRDTGEVIETWGSEVLGLQHHAKIMPDESVTVFNNGVGYGETKVTHFDSDASHTVLVNHGLGWFAESFGSVELLPNGNWLICDGRSKFDLGTGGARMLEYTSDFSQIVFEQELKVGAYVPYHSESEPPVMPLAYRCHRVATPFFAPTF